MKSPLDDRHAPSSSVVDARPTARNSRPRTKSPAKSKKKELQRSLRHTNSIELLQRRKTSVPGAHTVVDVGREGREGRQFRVGNVGNNGKIYLRYDNVAVEACAASDTDSHRTTLPQECLLTALRRLVSRPIPRAPGQPQQPRHPKAVLPIIPSLVPAPFDFDSRTHSSAVTLDALWNDVRAPRTHHRPLLPPLSAPAQASQLGRNGDRLASDAIGPSSHPRLGYQRAQSFSTLNEKPAKTADLAAFALTSTTTAGPTDRAGRQRPKTADQARLPILKVQIPNHRLGSPRFSAQGTAFLHSSIYTHSSANDELGSSTFSQADLERFFPLSSAVSPPSPSTVRQSSMSQDRVSGTWPQPHSRPWWRPHLARASIVPNIYDDLTSPQTADDPAIVRFSPVTGGIMAATVPRLVAQITSPSFLDYELLSDFFLTFRSFMTPADLVAYLLARLEWAVGRSDQVGKIVTVRTFVALRHWILNYFVDDFVPDYSLRVSFCDTLNLLCAALKAKPDGVVKEWKILSELKKCWRRTCALYWDQFPTSSELADVDLLPGGQAGVRGGRWTMMGSPGRGPVNSVRPNIDAAFGRDDGGAGPDTPADPATTSDRDRVRVPTNGSRPVDRAKLDPRYRTMSLSTDLSAPVVSCSIPGIKRAAQAVIHPHAGNHNAPNLPAVTAAAAAAVTRPHSKPGAAKFSPPSPRGRNEAHKRSGSFSDALRDRRAPLPQPKTEAESPPLLMAIPFSASLIRGHCMTPPPPPAVRALAPTTPVIEVQFFPSASRSEAERLFGHEKSSSSTSSASTNPYPPGMRKLFGSVRRALQYKDGADAHGPGVGNGCRTPRSPAHRMSPRDKSPVRSDSSRQGRAASLTTPRIDLLAAIIADEHKQAVNDKKGFEARAPEQYVRDVAGNELAFASSQALLPETDFVRSGARTRDPMSFSQGSKSIVIVDDTRASRQHPTPVPSPSRGFGPMTNVSYAVVGAAPAPLTSVDNETQQASTGRHASSGGAGDAFRPSGSADVASQSRDGVGQPASSRRPRRNGSSGVESQGRFPKRSYPNSLRTYPSIQSQLTFPTTDHSLDVLSATESRAYKTSEAPGHPPARMLRRQPGGDLRAANNLADLRQPTRPRSAGSLTVRSVSMAGSVVPRAGSIVMAGGGESEASGPGQVRRRFSLGALAEGGHGRRSLSLIATHSSQPNLRPSFEIEVARLAQLPDNEEGGDIASTLLKLEGRFERRPPGKMPSGGGVVSSTTASPGPAEKATPRVRRQTQPTPNQVIVDPSLNQDLSSLGPQEASSIVEENQTVETHGTDGEAPKDPYVHAIFAASIVDSDYSYSSTPILERGLSNKSVGGRQTRGTRSTSSVPPPLVARSQVRRVPVPKVELLSAGKIDKTNALPVTHPPSESTSRHSAAQASFLFDDDEPTTDSFLLDDDQELSDLSSELSDDVDRQDGDVKYPTPLFPRVTSGTVISEIGVPFHPLRHPPSPPPSADPATPTAAIFKQGHMYRRSPSPGPSLVEQAERREVPSPQKPVPMGREKSASTPEVSTVLGIGPKHLPFILEYESQLLAEQFTLLEKDALNGIDWKELVELRTTQASLDTRNWYRFVKSEAHGGVDLVIARFNVMVKWALSEIILTEDMDERARIISKYIHIAAHARRLRNFATMYQLMTAMLSTDCSRLKHTWLLVPDQDVDTFKELEGLVQPVRNFHKLRVEMEMASIEDGCIPFLGEPRHFSSAVNPASGAVQKLTQTSRQASTRTISCSTANVRP